MHRPFLHILAPCAAGNVASDYRLDGEDLEASDLHAAILKSGSKLGGAKRRGEGEG